MITNLKLSLSLFGALTFLQSCVYVDTRLRVENKLGVPIAVAPELDTIPRIVNFAQFYLENTIEVDSIYDLHNPRGNNAWENHILRSTNQKLNIYVFSIDTVKKYMNMDTLISRTLYFRISLTKHELDELDWKVTLDSTLLKNGH